MKPVNFKLNIYAIKNSKRDPQKVLKNGRYFEVVVNSGLTLLKECVTDLH